VFYWCFSNFEELYNNTYVDPYYYIYTNHMIGNRLLMGIHEDG